MSQRQRRGPEPPNRALPFPETAPHAPPRLAWVGWALANPHPNFKEDFLVPHHRRPPAPGLAGGAASASTSSSEPLLL